MNTLAVIAEDDVRPAGTIGPAPPFGPRPGVVSSAGPSWRYRRAHSEPPVLVAQAARGRVGEPERLRDAGLAERPAPWEIPRPTPTRG